jgi:excisionase family DNA binding protein
VVAVSSFVTIDDNFSRAMAGRVAELVLEQLPRTTEWLTVKQAAAHLQTTEDAIRALVKRGRIPCHRGAAGRILFDRAELDAWIRGDLQP